MRCAVFGGTGYIGSHLARKLVEAGHEVTILSRRTSALPADNIRLITGSLAQSDAVTQVLRGADVVYHLAWEGTPATEAFHPGKDANVKQSRNLLEQCAQQGARRVIFCSSGGAVYGPAMDLPIREDHPLHPISAYGQAKAAVEEALAQLRTANRLDAIVARPGNAYGGLQRTDGVQGVLGRLIWCLKHGHPFTIYTGGDVMRDFVHVEDVAEALVALGAYVGSERVFNIGSGAGTSISQLVELVEKSSGRQVTRQVEPARAFDVPSNILSSDLLQRETGWRPRHDLATEIRRLCAS
jgi:UDP-glucose 4-epimerase